MCGVPVEPHPGWDGDAVSIRQSVYQRSNRWEDEPVPAGVNGSLPDHDLSVAGDVPVPDELD